MLKPPMEWSPEALGLQNIDLQDDTAPYVSNIIDLTEYLRLGCFLDIDEAGTSNAGEISVQLLLFAKDGATLLATVDLLTAIDTTDSDEPYVIFGPGLIEAVNFGASGTLGAEIDKLRLISRAKVQVTVETENDGTSCTANVRFFAQN